MGNYLQINLIHKNKLIGYFTARNFFDFYKPIDFMQDILEPLIGSFADPSFKNWFLEVIHNKTPLSEKYEILEKNFLHFIKHTDFDIVPKNDFNFMTPEINPEEQECDVINIDLSTEKMFLHPKLERSFLYYVVYDQENNQDRITLTQNKKTTQVLYSLFNGVFAFEHLEALKKIIKFWSKKGGN